MDPATTVQALKQFDFANLREGLSAWPGVRPQDVNGATAWVESTVARLINLVETVEDPSEIAVLIAINYIELKTSWIALNTKINYSTFKRGSCETADALHASSVSAVIALLESMLSAHDIETITDFLAQPLNRAA